MQEYVKIGKLVAVHGLKGELVLEHSLGKKTNLKGLKAFFIESAPQRFLPYFLESATGKSDTESLVKIEGIETRESARLLMSREIWFRKEDMAAFSSQSAPISLLGFLIVHKQENLGEVIEVIEQPHQVLCTIMYKGKEAFIPIHAETLLKIDKRQKKLHVSLPDGLLELYTGS